MSALLPARALGRQLTLTAGIALCSASLVLGGCANRPTASAYGNYAAGSATFNQKLASDAIKQLVVMYPPASTRFDLTQPTPDPFGAALVAGLREKGYAVLESTPTATTRRPAPEKATSDPAAGVAGLNLGYVVDQPGAGNLYRLTLAIGSQSLTRAYLAQNESASAAGAWVRRE